MKTMPLLINLGKAITLIAWLMMAYNLAIPFEGKVAIILNILFGITCLMHCFQVAIFHMLFRTLLPLTKQDYLQVFIFGIFSLLAYRQKVMTTAS
jgi:putative membrane protein